MERRRNAIYRLGRKRKDTNCFLFQVPSFWSSWETVYEECKKCKRFDVKNELINGLMERRNETIPDMDFRDKKYFSGEQEGLRHIVLSIMRFQLIVVRS